MGAIEPNDHDPNDHDPNRSKWFFYGIGAILALAFMIVVAMIAALVFGARIQVDDAGPTTGEPIELPTSLAPGVDPDAPVATESPAWCSAAGYTSSPDQTGMPEAVAAKRAAIVSAASSCDIADVAALTGELFTASFGGGDPATLWSEAEARGEKPMRFLVELFDQPFGIMQSEGGEFYAWPKAFLYDSWDDVPEAERTGLRAIYSQEELNLFDETGAYVGYRIAIHESGDWVYFVGGD
jgi:hypothetical protein